MHIIDARCFSGSETELTSDQGLRSPRAKTLGTRLYRIKQFKGKTRIFGPPMIKLDCLLIGSRNCCPKRKPMNN